MLHGTGVALVTPFQEDGAIDFPALGRLIDFQINGGVDYLVLLGTTGETPVLSAEEKKSLIRFVREHIAGRVPLVVGMGGNDTAALVRDLRAYPLEGAVAVLSASPYYNKPSQEGLYRHYREVASASPLPVLLYNVPGRTGRNMSASTTLRLARDEKNIIGIKEASGDMAQCMEILQQRPDGFLVLSGDDPLALPQIACGMEGVISVAANAFPSAFSGMVRAARENRWAEARAANNRLIRAYDLMFAENNPAGVKAFLSGMDLIKNILRLPLVPVSQSLAEEIKGFKLDQ